MNKLTLALSALLMLAMVVVMAPNIFAANRGNILRNIALWLAAVVALALIYQTFGPGSAHPLFSLPASMSREGLARLPPAENATPESSGDKGFIPPKEE